MTAATYPPELHVIRDLRLETLKTAVDHAFVWAPVQPHACTDSGAVRLGALGAVVDSAGAVIAIAAAAPDWIATADLTYHRVAPVQAGPLVCAARLVRAGASTIIVAVDVHDGNGSESIETATLCGHGLMSFSRIPASASAIKIDPFANVGVRTTGALPDSRVDAPLFDKIGLRVVDAAAGVVEVDKHDYVRNSFGTINGGVICMIFEAAAEHAARADRAAQAGGSWRVTVARSSSWSSLPASTARRLTMLGPPTSRDTEPDVRAGPTLTWDR